MVTFFYQWHPGNSLNELIHLWRKEFRKKQHGGSICKDNETSFNQFYEITQKYLLDVEIYIFLQTQVQKNFYIILLP